MKKVINYVGRIFTKKEGQELSVNYLNRKNAIRQNVDAANLISATVLKVNFALLDLVLLAQFKNMNNTPEEVLLLLKLEAAGVSF